MQIIQATQAGVAAYRAGRGRAPALNQEFIVAACASETATTNLFTAYMRGWTIASLADGEQDPTMPSVIELARLDALTTVEA